AGFDGEALGIDVRANFKTSLTLAGPLMTATDSPVVPTFDHFINLRVSSCCDAESTATFSSATTLPLVSLTRSPALSSDAFFTLDMDGRTIAATFHGALVSATDSPLAPVQNRLAQIEFSSDSAGSS